MLTIDVDAEPEDSRTKAILDGIKGYINKRLTEAGRDKANAASTTTIVEFPTEQLANVLAKELSNALGSLKWPDPPKPSALTTVIQPAPVSVGVDNAEVAKALLQVGKMVSEVPIPVVEAIDLLPIVASIAELVQVVDESNKLTREAIDANTEALTELVKALGKKRDKRRYKIDEDTVVEV